jgi:hypothetical protein
MQGRCACGEIRYRLNAKPLIVHCCHCRWCQRETGSAFVLNALIETSEVELLSGKPHMVDTPSESGNGQKIHRCPTCDVAVWSVYSGAGEDFCFVRVGTLEYPDACPPDVHIYTESKQPWVTLSGDTPVFEQYYRRSAVWPEDSLRRREAVLARRKR